MNLNCPQLIDETDEALQELDNITASEEIGVDELGVTTILLEALTIGAGQSETVCTPQRWIDCTCNMLSCSTPTHSSLKTCSKWWTICWWWTPQLCK